MNDELNSDILEQEYIEEIRTWDWGYIREEFEKLSLTEDCYEDNGDGDRFVYQFIGSVFALTPSGKFYMPWTTNQTEEDVVRDTAWWAALEKVAAEHDCFVGSPDGCAGDDVFLCKRFDTPAEIEDEDDDDVS
jgi:hypothetical protein